MATTNPTTTPTLDNYFANERKRVEDQHALDLAALNASRNRQHQQAAINDELLRKYLPQMNQMSGLSGLGVSESANIDALSRYQNNVTSIDQGYQQSKSELDRYRDDRLASINAAERTEQREKYGSAQEWIMSGAIDSQEALDKYLTSMGYAEGTTEYNELSAYAAPYITEEEESTAEGAATLSGTTSVNGKDVSMEFPVEYQGNKGTAKVSLDIIAEAADQDLGENKAEGAVFFSGNKIYYKKNGVVYELGDGRKGYTGDKYSAVYSYFANGATATKLDPRWVLNPEFEIRDDETEPPKTKEFYSPKVPAKPRKTASVIDPDDGTIRIVDKDGSVKYGYTEIDPYLDSKMNFKTSTRNVDDGIVVTYKPVGTGKSTDYVKIDGTLYRIVYTS